MPKIIKFLGLNKFLTGSKPAWVDFYFFEMIEYMQFLYDGNLFLLFPILSTYHSNVKNLPLLKEYLLHPNCPEKTRQFNNKHAKLNNL